MNYLEFGLFTKNKKKVYEFKKGNFYDEYMLSRYFKDMFTVSKYKKGKLNYIIKNLHDKKDLKFNLINLILININKKKFYEFGFTLLEKIFIFIFLSKVFKLNKLNIKKVEFCGNEISEKFIFFAENFFKEYKTSLFKKVNFNKIKKSVFFTKGVSILYEKNNTDILNRAIQQASCGSLDISLSKKNKIRKKLETGYTLYYPSIYDFKKIIKNNKSKKFLFRNIKMTKNKIYFEVIFGSHIIIKKFKKKFLQIIKENKNNRTLTRAFDLNKKFYNEIDFLT